MALQLYTLASVYINGQLLSEEARVTVDRETKSQEVATVAKGFAGLSPGAAVTNITVENAVPAVGFEKDMSTIMKQLQVVELTIFAAGSTLTSKGFIISDNFSHAVNSESKLDFKFIGEFATWSAL